MLYKTFNIFIISNFKDMTLHLRQVWSENEVKPRVMTPWIDSLILQWIFWTEVTDINAEVSKATLDQASELLWIISSHYKQAWLETDAFQVPYKVQVPEKKLFMAGELVVHQPDTQKVWDIIMYSGMRTYSDEKGKVLWHIKAQNHINLELPLWEYRWVTKEVVGKVWWIIDKLESTRLWDPMIVHISRPRYGDESRKSIWYQALNDADIRDLPPKKLYDNINDLDFLI